jgi:hypothetical protein
MQQRSRKRQQTDEEDNGKDSNPAKDPHDG